MSLTFQKAQLSDLDLLVQTRLTVLRAANELPTDTPLPQVEEQSRIYYADALADGSHTAYLSLTVIAGLVRVASAIFALCPRWTIRPVKRDTI